MNPILDSILLMLWCINIILTFLGGLEAFEDRLEKEEEEKEEQRQKEEERRLNISSKTRNR